MLLFGNLVIIPRIWTCIFRAPFHLCRTQFSCLILGIQQLNDCSNHITILGMICSPESGVETINRISSIGIMLSTVGWCVLYSNCTEKQAQI